MKDLLLTGLHDSSTLLEALPFGAAVYDNARRLVFANTALPLLVGLPPGSFKPGASFSDHVRLMAHRGYYGPGDPERQADEIASIDLSAPRRLRRRHPDGRCFEVFLNPLPEGATFVCVVDTTALVAMRDEAERAAGRVHAALAGLHAGLAVFGADRGLALSNPSFATLLGLPQNALRPGLQFADLLQMLQARQDFSGLEGDMFLAGQLALDRARPSRFQRERSDGRVIDVQSDPLAGGGWTWTVSDITRLAVAEDEARRRAGTLDSILRQVPHGIVVYGPDRRVRMVNEAYGLIMTGAPVAVGETQEAVVRRRVEAGEYGEGDREAQIGEQLDQDMSVPQVRRRQRPNGSTIDIRTAPLPDGGYIIVITDVTSLMTAQVERGREAELMASIVSHIPHGVSVYGPDRRLRMVNAAYRRIMDGAPIVVGESIDEIIAKRVQAGEFGPGDPEEIAGEQGAHDIARPQVRRRSRPNGTTIDIRTAPLPDGGHISVVTDTTPLTQAEAELQRRAAVMDAMLANIEHGVILWDRDRRIVAANPVVADLLGAAAGVIVPGATLEAVTQSALDRGNLGTGAAALARAQHLLEQDRSKQHVDQRLTRTARVIEVRSDPAPDGGFVTTYTDVTPIREAEEALRLAKTAAEAANTAKSRFLAAMSIELRSPLNEILNELSALARDATGVITHSLGGQPAYGLDAGQVQSASDRAAAAARHLMGLIDSILDVARLESGRFELSNDTVDVTQLVRECLRKSDSAAAAAEVALVVELPDPLPPIRCDQRRMRQVLGHLVGNAVKFTGPMGSVSISARQEWSSGDLLLRVQDTGVGIAEQELEHVFEPFSQAEGAQRDGRRTPGAGLGLYISRTLLRAHGGDLVLQSTPGRGTRAELRIPANRVLHDAPHDPT